jgi:catechol 2,3-dioxygenase-like lactoylglutathione lyase family enzyme
MPATSVRTALDTVDHVAVSVSNVAEAVDWYRERFQCEVLYQDTSWAFVKFANIRVAFVIPEQHPPHFAVLGDPRSFGEPRTHRDGTSSVYLKDPAGNSVEILECPAKSG